jgi:predicted ATPase/DNA-binding SARP family transcriptional activator
MSAVDETATLLVDVLGPLQVRDDSGRRLEVPGARLRTLLVRLALEEGRAVSARTLVADLWGEGAPAGELNALQSLVSRLRRAVRQPASIPQLAGGYRVRLAPDGLDLARFRWLADTGRAQLRAGDAAAAVGTLGEALDLWRGPVASEIESVAPGVADILEAQRLEVVLDRMQARLELGQAAELLEDLAPLRARHPLNERIAELEVRALSAGGRTADALRSYERVRTELAESLGVDPSAALRDAHLAALQADGTTGSGSPTVPERNLPFAVTSFLGREQELARVADLLRTSRLVTILGPGGAGKTRLALEAGRASPRPVAVWLVELAGVTDERDVPQAVLAALGLRDATVLDRRLPRAPREAMTLLVERLQTGRALAILDNCEHVIDAAARLTDTLLSACPGLAVLATSREPLAITGEFLVNLAPLAVPEPASTVDDARLLPAVALFVDRARAVQPDFALDGSNVEPVVEIVRRLDGLPLALELAAARMRTLPVAEIALRLSNRFRLLVGGSRTAVPRHRTLRAVVAWSWDLLSPAERLLAERVAVFPAGLTRVSAAAVCADPGLAPGLAPDEVSDLLDALVDRSLLQLAPAGDRYRVLETIREYGQEQLAARGELELVALTAARHFAALAAEADSYLRTRDQLCWLNRLRGEHDNVLAALRTFCDAGNAAAALALTLDLGWYWLLLGRHAEAAGAADAALLLDAPADPELRFGAEVVRTMNRMAADGALNADGPGELPTRPATRSGTVAENRPVVALLAPVMRYFGDDPEAGRREFDQLIADGDAWLQAAARLFRARFAENDGDLASVRVHTEAALAAFRVIGDRWGITSTLPLVGLLRVYDGDLDGALSVLLEARAAAGMFGSVDLDDQLFLAIRLSDVRARRGEWDEARAALREAGDFAERMAGVEPRLILEALGGGFERVAGDLTAARSRQEKADRALPEVRERAFGGDHFVAMVSSSGAMLDLAAGDLRAAAERLPLSYAAGLQSRDMPILAVVGVAVADVAQAAGLASESAEILGASARLRGAEDPTNPDVARIRVGIDRILGPPSAADAFARGFTLDREAAKRRLDPALLTLPGSSGPSDPLTGTRG